MDYVSPKWKTDGSLEKVSHVDGQGIHFTHIALPV